jgi:hypothetical protein
LGFKPEHLCRVKTNSSFTQFLTSTTYFNNYYIHGQMIVLPLHLSGGTDGNHASGRIVTSQSPSLYLNLEPSKYKAKVLTARL